MSKHRFSIALECVKRAGGLSGTYADTGSTTVTLSQPIALIDINEGNGGYWVYTNQSQFRNVFQSPTFGSFGAEGGMWSDGVLRNNGVFVLQLTNFYINTRRRTFGVANWNLDPQGNQWNSWAYYKRILHPIEMSPDERTEEMIALVCDGMFYQEVGSQLANVMDPKNISMMLGIFALCASNPVGWFAGALAVLLGIGGIATDWVTLEPLWKEFQSRRYYASDEAALQSGARALAQLLAQIVIEILTAKVMDAAGKQIPIERIKAAFQRKPEEWEVAAAKAGAEREQASGPPRPQPNPRVNRDLVQQCVARPTSQLTCREFGDFPRFQYRPVAEVRAWLQANGFRMVAPAQGPNSEIWIRTRPSLLGNSNIEAVRIDPAGHPPGPRALANPPEGRIEMTRGPNGQVDSTRLPEWGTAAHMHKELVPYDALMSYMAAPTENLKFADWNTRTPQGSWQAEHIQLQP